MSLLRLLTAGKTLVGLKKPEHRYHLPGEAALPKFGSERRIPSERPCSRTKSETGEIVASAAAPEFAAADVTGPADPTLCTSSGCGAGMQPTDGQTRFLALVEARQPDRRPDIAFKALLLWGRAKKANPARPHWRVAPLIQGELSLDKVKVVRNDLSETDFEIVPSEHAPRGTMTGTPSVGLPTAPASDGAVPCGGGQNVSWSDNAECQDSTTNQ